MVWVRSMCWAIYSTFTLFVSDSLFSCTICHAAALWDDKSQRENVRKRERESESTGEVVGREWLRESVRKEFGWNTRHKAVYCIMYICNHPLALLAHAIQCLELHVTHFCLLFTLFIVQNNFRCSIPYTHTHTHTRTRYTYSLLYNNKTNTHKYTKIFTWSSQHVYYYYSRGAWSSQNTSRVELSWVAWATTHHCMALRRDKIGKNYYYTFSGM